MSTEPQPNRPDADRSPASELAEYHGVDRAMSLIEAQSGSIEGRVLTNYVGEPRERFRFIQHCLGPNCREGKLHLDTPIDLEHYFVTTIEQLNEETGEYKPAVYVVLVDTVGVATGFWSAFVARDLGRLIQSLGEPSHDMPHRVKVTEARRPGKREWYTLELV